MRRSSSPSGKAQQANKSQKRSQHSSPSSPESTTVASSIPTSKPIRHDSVTAPILPTTTANIAMQRDTGLMTPDPDNDFESLPTYVELNATTASASGLHNVTNVDSDVAMADNMVTESEPEVTTATITSTTLQTLAPSFTTTDLPTPRADTPTDLSTNQPQTQQTTTGDSTTNQAQNQTRIHQPTGYRWTREEDAPTYLWRSAKAAEEMERALVLIVDREKVIGRKYGDIGLSK